MYCKAYVCLESNTLRSCCGMLSFVHLHCTFYVTCMWIWCLGWCGKACVLACFVFKWRQAGWGCLSFFMSPPSLKNGAGGILYSGLSIREWVRESVCPENLVNTISKKPIKGILATEVFAFVDVLIRFWGQRSMSRQADDTISPITMKAVFTRTWLRYVCVFAIAIPSVVCNIGAPYSGGWTFRNSSSPLCTQAILTSAQNFTEIVPREPLHR